MARERTSATEIERAQARIAALEAALIVERERAAGLEAERDRVRKAYDELKIELELLRRKIFAAKAERVDTSQLEMDFAHKLAAIDALEGRLGGASAGATPPAREPKKRKPSGRRDLASVDLPVERIEITDAVMEALVAEGKAKAIGFEESSKIGYRRAGHTCVVIARVKYLVEPIDAAASDEGATPKATIATAPMPAELLPRSLVTPSLLAKIASEKFTYGMPLFRQEEKCAAEGVPIDRGSMSRWLEHAGNTVGATVIVAAREDAIRTALCLATDATGISVQPIPGHEKARQACKKGHFFVQIADRDHVFFEYTPRETSAAVLEMFRGFSGYVQADAKSVYDLLFRDPEPDDDVEPDGATRYELACWAHARRKFYDAAAITKDVVAREGLYRIHRVFENEETFRRMGPAQRKEMRLRLSRPHLVAFFDWVEVEYRNVADQRGLLRSALVYARRQKDALMRFLEDGRLVIDNNRSERELRRVAVGRKNWLFVGSDDHAEAAASLFSMIASAKLHRLEPEGYLRDLFRVLAQWPNDRYLELAPKYWAATRARLDPAELALEVGPLTIPPPPEQQPPPG